MNKLILVALVAASIAASLVACGGGSGAPAVTTPGASSGTTPGAGSGGGGATAIPFTPEMVAAPIMPAKSVNVSGANGLFKVDDMIMLFKYAGTASFELAGKNNTVWFNDGQALSTVNVTGSNNTLVFRPGASAASLSVAAGNTVYLPSGSAVKVEGGGTAKYYAQ